jgi:hypothetical protein
MAVILLLVLIQTYRFATISSMRIGGSKIGQTRFDDFDNLSASQSCYQSGSLPDKHFGKCRFTDNNRQTIRRKQILTPLHGRE